MTIIENFNKEETYGVSANTLVHGDCLEVMKCIKDKSIDMILCDLPYEITSLSWDKMIPFDKLGEQYNRIIKEEGIVILFGVQPFTSKIISSNPKDFRYELIWEKNKNSSFQLAKLQPLRIHENICIFYKDIIQNTFSNIMYENMKKLNLKQSDLSDLILSKNGNKTGWVFNKLSGSQIPTRSQWSKLCEVLKIENNYDYLLSQLKKHTYNPPTYKINKNIKNTISKEGSLGNFKMKSDTYIQENTNYPKSILKFKKDGNMHPTQKPVALLEYLIKIYSNENDTILDNCMGSGSTGVACVNTNRNFIGIELDDKYFEIAKDRIEKAQENIFNI